VALGVVLIAQTDTFDNAFTPSAQAFTVVYFFIFLFFYFFLNLGNKIIFYFLI
jgi:hypothetical protein